MTHEGCPQPEQLARELKLLLRMGTRPVTVVYQLHKLPGLIEACASEYPPVQRWEIARAICSHVAEAINNLGDDTSTICARALFGTRPSSRGLRLGQRRKEAANELAYILPTFVRHYESDLVLEVAARIYFCAASTEG
jgi:hypothetical protein